MQSIVRFFREEAGFVAGPEWAFVSAVLVLGAITATLAVRQAAAHQEADLPPAAVRQN